MQKRTTLFTLIIVNTIILTLTTIGLAQDDKSKRPSPPAHAQCQFPDGKTIKTDYSSPRTHDPKTHQPRKIFGGVVPYGQVWRTGANEATTFVTDTNLSIGDKEIPAGSYTIFTVPNQDKWSLIINKKNAEWGIPYKYEADEIGRFDMSVSKTSAPVENFTISFHEMGTGCHMNLDWENTRATIEISEKK